MTRAVGMLFIVALLGGGLWLIFGPAYFSPAPVPYLQKFEGRWRVVFTPDQQSQAQGIGCVPQSADAAVHNGALADTALFISMVGLKATVSPQGGLSGTFVINKTHTGSLSGVIKGLSGTGTWSDSLGCRGSLALSKQDPIVDPVMGRVVSAQGAELVRAGGSQELLPGTLLYAGDTVEATEGQALLSMGTLGQPVSVSNGTYTVLAPK